jgi:hypothetical protein
MNIQKKIKFDGSIEKYKVMVIVRGYKQKESLTTSTPTH